jgi:hypothetical protein
MRLLCYFNLRNMGRHLPLLLLLAGFFVLEFAYPRFPHWDEIAFKSAGRSISEGGAFAAPEFEGFLRLNPPIERVYFTYPPLYSWLFGQWTRAIGFGWVACVGYDALISAVLAVIVYGLAGAVADALLGPISILRRTILALVPALLTLLFRQVARPDELAMALGFANAWWLFALRTDSLRLPILTFVSGVLAGLMLCTSPGVFLAFLPFFVALWLLRVDGMQEIAPSLAAAGLGGALAVALCLTPLFLVDPHFYRQIFDHARHRVFGYGIAWMFSDTWASHRQSVFIVLATVPVLCLGLMHLWRIGRVSETLVLFVAPMIGFALALLSRGHVNYWWFLQPWLLLVAITVTADFWWSKRPRLLATAVVGWLTAWLVAASAWPVKEYLVRVTLPPEQRLAPNAQKLRELIPIGAGVLTLDGWWALGNDRFVYDPMFSDVQDLDRIEYFVTDSNGTGQPIRPNNPRYNTMLRESFEVISDTLPTTPVEVFGLRITKGAYGFGTLVLRRAQAQPR